MTIKTYNANLKKLKLLAKLEKICYKETLMEEMYKQARKVTLNMYPNASVQFLNTIEDYCSAKRQIFYAMANIMGE